MASPLRGDSPVRGGGHIPEGKSDKKIEESDDRKRVKEASEVLKGRTGEAAQHKKPPTRKARELKGDKTDKASEKAAEVAKSTEEIIEPKVKKPAGGVSMFGGMGHEDKLKAAIARRGEGKSIRGGKEEVEAKSKDVVEEKPKEVGKKPVGEPDTGSRLPAKAYRRDKEIEPLPMGVKTRHKGEQEGHEESTLYNPTGRAEEERKAAEERKKKPVFGSEVERNAFEKQFGKFGGPVTPATREERVSDKGKAEKQPPVSGKGKPESDSDDDWVVIPKEKK